MIYELICGKVEIAPFRLQHSTCFAFAHILSVQSVRRQLM